MEDFHNLFQPSKVWDWWVDKKAGKAYCIYWLIHEKDSDTGSNLRFIESDYKED